MFDANTLVTEYANLVGWRQYRDTTQINLPTSLTDTTTGEYYQQKHAALRLDYIQTLLPSDFPLQDYLRQVITESTVEMFNDFLNSRMKEKYGKTLLDSKVLLNRYGFRTDAIANQNRFVGIQIRLRTAEGLTAIINQLGLQFTGNDTFNIYLFHSSKQQPLNVFEVTTNSNGFWKWVDYNQVLKAFDDLNYLGGVFVLGYYQEDIGGNAINYTNFNWKNGVCGTCNDQYYKLWVEYQKYMTFCPLYVPQGDYIKGEMFDLQKAFYVYDQSYGLNFRTSVMCDFTQFFKENKRSFKDALQWKVVTKVLNMMKFSQQINSIEHELKIMIIRDLEGDSETTFENLPQLYFDALDAVKFNTSNINSFCLDCEERRQGPSYTAM